MSVFSREIIIAHKINAQFHQIFVCLATLFFNRFFNRCSAENQLSRKKTVDYHRFESSI